MKTFSIILCIRVSVRLFRQILSRCFGFGCFGKTALRSITINNQNTLICTKTLKYFQQILDNGYVVGTLLRLFQYDSKALRKKFNGALPFRLSSQKLRWVTSQAGLIIPKYSALQKLFASVAIRLREAGIVDDKITGGYLYFWQPPEKPELALTPIGLEHIASGVIFYAIGLILAIVAFIGELFASSKHRSRSSIIGVQPIVL